MNTQDLIKRWAEEWMATRAFMNTLVSIIKADPEDEWLAEEFIQLYNACDAESDWRPGVEAYLANVMQADYDEPTDWATTYWAACNLLDGDTDD